MLNIFLWISLYKPLVKSPMTIRQESRRSRRSLILNTYPHVVSYLLHIDCLLNKGDFVATTYQNLKNSKISKKNPNFAKFIGRAKNLWKFWISMCFLDFC